MLYFAYGSNMSTPRLAARLRVAEPVDVAELSGHRLAFHMAGADGSAKCDAFCTGASGDMVIGVVFRIDAREKPVLDGFEGLGVGYALKPVRVVSPRYGPMDAFLYVATQIDEGRRPYDWYKGHVLHGALEHGLPPDYVRCIEAIESLPDPDARRHAAEVAIYGAAGR